MNLFSMMPFAAVLRDYRVGSYEWTWEQEFADVRERFGDSFDVLCTDIQENGIREPILLGDDGRVWDGHKRLTVAHVLALETVPVVRSEDLYDDERWSTTMSNLFQRGAFTLHSGDISQWKIECDALSDDDISTIAYMLDEVLPEFGSVVGIPRGGTRLAKALAPYAEPAFTDRVLIVDDVLSTGASMEAERAGRDAIGAVIFARSLCPAWITPLFAMPTSLGQAKLAYRLYSVLRPIVEAAEEAAEQGYTLTFLQGEFANARRALDAYGAVARNDATSTR